MNDEKEIKCVYCGIDYDLEREHVIPVIYFNERSYDRSKQWIVPGCRECNNLAGSKLFFSIPAKAAFILSRYKARYRKILKTAYWSGSELNELGYSLRSSIKEMMVAKNVLEKKFINLKNTTELPLDYLRPKFIEEKIREWKKQYKKLKKKKSRKIRSKR